jgi:hypothetical protein
MNINITNPIAISDSNFNDNENGLLFTLIKCLVYNEQIIICILNSFNVYSNNRGITITQTQSIFLINIIVQINNVTIYNNTKKLYHKL